MALPSTGSLSFSQIEQEFGNNNTEADEKRTLGKYRISQTVGGMSNLPLDTGIARGTSPIKFSEFRGKRLNVVVSYNTTNTGGIERATYAKEKYDDKDDITVIGGFKDIPSDTSGSKIIIHVHNNVSLGSTTLTRKHCALRTGGGWQSGTVLEINIGKNAMVSGAGGNGGNGGRPFSNAGIGYSGENGSSAIGIAFPVEKITIQEGAIVRAGAGGGGGGGGAAGEGHPESDERVGGAGGGGGVGIPAGLGGVAGSNSSDGGTAYGNVEEQPINGGNGSQTIGGNGGFGGLNNEGESDNTPTAQSGGGGGGGFLGEGGGSYTQLGGGNSGTGGDGNIIDAGAGEDSGKGGDGGPGDAEGSNQEQGSGGSGGLGGYAIVTKNNAPVPNVEGDGSLIGTTITHANDFEI